jgi:hypothetical protein
MKYIDGDKLLEYLPKLSDVTNEDIFNMKGVSKRMSLYSLEWNLFTRVWDNDKGKYGIYAPIQILDMETSDSKSVRNHFSRICKADLRFPIIIIWHTTEKKWFIIDGYHRLAKAYRMGKNTIRTKIVDYRNFMEHN